MCRNRGGGNEFNLHLDLTRPSLRWMFLEASAAGLRLRDPPLSSEDKEPKIHESLTLLWRPFERLPFRRLTYNEKMTYGRLADNRWILVEILACFVWKLAEFLLLFLWFLWKLLLMDWRGLSSALRASASLKDTVSWYVIQDIA